VSAAHGPSRVEVNCPICRHFVHLKWNFIWTVTLLIGTQEGVLDVQGAADETMII
jgi:hypothetical protein